jgi:hypothetical protein
MNSESRSSNTDGSRLVDFIERSLQVSRRTTAALEARNPAQLEESLEAQHALLVEFSQFRFAAGDCPSSVKDMVREVQLVNRKNARLTENGLALTDRLLNVIFPPLTYETLGHSSPVNRTVAESTISLKV